MAIKRAYFDDNSVKEAAFHLRSLILSLTTKSFPDPITVQSLVEDQHETPQPLIDFFNVLYTGSAVGQGSQKSKRIVRSLCDTIFTTSRGRIKPGKHMSLGLGLKSITGSRRVLEILNRFGHCVNYHTVESFETQIASDISEGYEATPDGLIKYPGLITSLAWDNYDENTETLSGSGTLHDTVGICYQNQPTEEELNVVFNRENTQKIAQKARTSKRKLIFQEQNLAPYRKKPKISEFDYTIKEALVPVNLSAVQRLDYYWMMNVATFQHTPMWIGWNSLVSVDNLPIQNNAYM